MTKIKINGGVDVGNGYTKSALRVGTEPEKFDLPSGIALVTGAADIPSKDEMAASVVLAPEFFNELDVTFNSPLISTTHRHLFGKRAVHAKTPRFMEFDVVSGTSKAEQSLSAALVLGVFAAKALRAYVEEHDKLPEDQLDVEARVGLALPIDEYRDYREGYVHGFRQGTHLVTIHNFETAVIVRIKFADVQVFPEGSSGQFAIRQHGVPFAEHMLAGASQRGVEFPGVTGQHVYDARSTLGIDIGEGTVNFPVYSNGKFNVDSSRTFDKGYGTVLENSLEPLARMKKSFSSRKALAEYLLNEPSPLKRAEYDQVKAVVAEQEQLFSEALAEEVRQLFAEVGRDTEVVYVFGGGSGPLRDTLYPLLTDVVGTGSPVLYLDSQYSRHLNREGLLIAIDMVEKAAEAAEKAAAKPAKKA